MKLQKNTSYINTWNTFSKAMLLKKVNIENWLIIVESDKDVHNYKKIFEYIWIDYREIDNYSIFIDLIFNQKWFFITNSLLCEIYFDKPSQIKYNSILLNINESIIIEELIKKLNDLWYKFCEYNNAWTYSKKWDILTITSTDNKKVYTISFWWEIIEEISDNKNNTYSKLYIWKNINIFDFNNSNSKNTIYDLLWNTIFTIIDSLDFNKNYENLTNNLKNYCSFDYVWNKNLIINNLEIKNIKINTLNEFKDILENKNNNITIYTKSEKTIKQYLEYNNIKGIKLRLSELNNLKSYRDNHWGDKNHMNDYNICDDIISSLFTRKRIKKNLSQDLDLLLKIKTWDYIVHIDHGIGIFKQIIKKELWWINKEYIEIEYSNNDKLFVPITEVSRVNKYIGEENPKLTPLNTWIWEKKLNKAKEEVEEIAVELLELYSKRKVANWYIFKEYKEKEQLFRNDFSYIYTQDQEHAINDILDKMNNQKPMDMLLVWDVWFWKTEIAFNAIYRSFLNKKQSILISPLVVLAYEHFEKAKDRFKNFWMNIEILTRLETEKQTNIVLKKLDLWEIDLVIWTHKLLNDNITYKDLWLIVVDEEHKFWVNDKEKIKKYKNKIDILSMSATPIPRSLNMALSSIRDMTILKTPPLWRQNIDTQVNRYNERLIEEIGQKEFARWWQIFFVHNRVSNLENHKIILQNIFPNKKIIVTHGQLPWIELEKRIVDFKHKKYDILLSTTVIENGIDFSNVNTIFINDAPNFWLSQIHQLRWRVGRSDKKWYCQLLYSKESLKNDTAKRLKSIVEHSYLWAWFELAMKDLEIRGWWDLLGFRQSGQKSQIWINLYLKMIEDKIEELKITNTWNISIKNKKKLYTNTKIDLNISASIADDYFSNELDKINFYREIESINDLEELKYIINDFENENTNNEKLPQSSINLFNLIKLKLLAQNYWINHIKKAWINYQIDFAIEDLEILKNFLDLDKEVKFIVINGSRLRSPIKNFENEEKFIQYMLLLFENKINNNKIKLKKKYN